MAEGTVGMFSASSFRESMDGLGWNAQQVSDHLGLGVNMISGMRTGKKTPSLEALTRIAALFNKPVADFLDLPPAADWTLRHFRVAAGLTQAAVAQRLGVDSSAVSKWELQRSRPPKSTVDRLATLYNTTPTELRQAIERAHDGPAEQMLTLTDSVRALAQIGVRSVLREPDSARRRQTLADIRARIIQSLIVLNAAMPHLDANTHTRAQQTVDQLAQILSDTAEVDQ